MEVLEIIWRDWNFLIVVMGVALLSIALNQPDRAHVAEIERFATAQGLRVVKVDRLPRHIPPIRHWRMMFRTGDFYAVVVTDFGGERSRIEIAFDESSPESPITVMKRRALKG